MNLKKFSAILLCVILTLSAFGAFADDTHELPTNYCVAEEITGDDLNIMAVPYYNYNGEAEELKLDIAMHFETTQTNEEAKTKPYYSYVADFELTFDHDVTAILAGKHSWFTDYVGEDWWLSIKEESATEYGDIDGMDFIANEPVKIMSFIDENFTYRDILSIKEFDCGVKFAYDAPSQIEAKLELVMYSTTEVTSDDEYDYVLIIDGVNHYYVVNREDRHVIAGNTFVYGDASHEITPDSTDAQKADALNKDVESITTPEAAVGATQLIESLEQSAKDEIIPEVVIAIAQNTAGAVNDAFDGTVADVVYNLTPSTTVTVVDITDAPEVAPVLEEGTVVVEVTVTDDHSGEELETVPAPVVVGIPVADASKVKKVIHLHDGVLEDVKFTVKDNIVYIQMSKFSQVAIIEDTVTTYNVTVNPSYGGTVAVNVAEALEGETIKITATPDVNYVFDTISVKDAEGNLVEVINNKFTMPASDVTVSVLFKSTLSRPSASNPSVGGGNSTPVQYTVKFDTNGGSEIADVKVEKGKTVEAPEAPVKENNIFVGWFADKELTEEFDFDTEIKKATTIYAGWIEITAENSIVLVIDEKVATVFGEEVENDVAPVIVNERTMLPARFVAESLGANVEWEEETEKVTITMGEKVIEIFIGKDYAMVDGKEIDLDAPAFIENSRTYLPIRFISEELGAYVNWDDETKTVTITKVQ